MKDKPGKSLRRRLRLWDEAAGRCHYCERQMLKPTATDGKKGQRPNLCTVEHLDHAFTGQRSNTRVVASCRECNEMWGNAIHNEYRIRATYPPGHHLFVPGLATRLVAHVLGEL